MRLRREPLDSGLDLSFNIVFQLQEQLSLNPLRVWPGLVPALQSTYFQELGLPVRRSPMAPEFMAMFISSETRGNKPRRKGGSLDKEK